MPESMEIDPYECDAFLRPNMECAEYDADSLAETIESEISDKLPQEPVRMSLREQEIQFIENHGLIVFCHGLIITAILQDPDYLRAQLTYLSK